MYHARSTLRRAPLAAAATVAVAASLVSAGPAAFADPPPTSTPAIGTTGQGTPDTVTLDGVNPGPKTITLITGDTVTLTDQGSGRYQVETTAAPRPDGSVPTFESQADNGEYHVYPSDVIPAIRSGLLDDDLFDVAYLAENGYTDADTDQVPVIAQYSSARSQRSLAATAESLPASTPTIDLSSVHATALTVAKGSAEDFWSAIRPAQSGPAARPRALTTGMSHLWLDRRLTATLDESVPMIGAPEAWAEGLDGTGVTVAVLDTGYDENHPDLAGKVTLDRSFVPGSTTHDGHGHGTHVASTIAGSGAASDGQYTGVAPGVDLMVGKILDDTGHGNASWGIAGMEWAARNGADIINMSLGSGPTDGTDPASQAVNELTAETGALFVIAAGNAGPNPYTVNAPGVADAALTVSAVDKSDQLAGFSSRGPRLDGALKPDIAAPGVNITAARSAGTDMGGVAHPVNEFYDTVNGTSQATPHVAGAAAILAQEHPDWSPERIKAALMSTSEDDGFIVYEQGAGRVDIAAAVDRSVVATTPNVDFGSVQDDAAPGSRQITYANAGDADVTLTLTPNLSAAGGDPAPEGILSVDDQVTVPAGGTATATVGLDPAGLDDGIYSGAIVATDETTGTSLSIPVGVVRQPPMVNLTIRTVAFDGQPAQPDLVGIVDVTGDRKSFTQGAQWVSTGVLRVPVTKTTISITESFGWLDDDNRANVAHLNVPEITVTGDTEITLDVRDANPLSFDTDRPVESSPGSSAITLHSSRTRTDGTKSIFTTSAAPFVRLWASPAPRVTKGDFTLSATLALTAPEVTLRVRGRSRLDPHPLTWPHDLDVDRNGGTRVPFTGTHTWNIVNVGTGTAAELADLNVDGKLALLDAGQSCWVEVDRVLALRDAGATGVVVWPSADVNTACLGGPVIPLQVRGTGIDASTEIGIPYVTIAPREARALIDELASDPVRITVTGTPRSPYVYEAYANERGGVSDSLTYDLTGRNVVTVDSEYHGTEPTVFETRSQVFDMKTDEMYTVYPPALTGPGTRTEYLGPLGSDLAYDVMTASNDHVYSKVVRLDEPARIRAAWNGAAPVSGSPTFSDEIVDISNPDPLRPVGQRAGLCVMCRSGDDFYPLYSHSYGDGVWRDTFIAPTNTHLYRGDEEIPLSPSPAGVPVFQMPSEPSDYRLTLDDGGIRTHTEWTFHSAGTPSEYDAPNTLWCGSTFFDPNRPCRPEPLVYASYDLGDWLGMDNTVRAGNAHLFTVNAYHAPSRGEMPDIAGLRLWYSVDDGDHWIPALVLPSGHGSYRVLALYPPYRFTSGAVSLKVQAWDEAGNTLTQTTTRAFELRAWHSRHTGPTAR